MKHKMANRFIHNYKKTTLMRTIILFAGVLFALNLYGDSHNNSGANNYVPDITNPFHDIFNLYFNNYKKEAANLLKKQFNSKRLKNQAYINYGLMQELEKNYPEAEKYYRMALANNEKISILYLNNLYKNYDKEKLLPLLYAVQNHEVNYWTLYEQAAYYLEIEDRDKALGCLSEAIDNGFSSVDLLRNDPVFNNIKNTFKFKWLVHRAKNNITKSKSISQKLKEIEYEFLSNKLFGVNRELDAAANYEKVGKDKKALNILESLLQSKLSFRDRSTTLFWLARINTRIGETKTARKYLLDFTDYISGQEKDETGYKDLIYPVYKDIIANDVSLKKLLENK